MKENGVSGPGSLVYIQPKESYPKKQILIDDPSVSIPFPELCGENVEFLGKSSDGIFAISNFRFFAAYQHAFINIPLMLIESLELKGKELPEIYICCKNGQSIQLKFDSPEDCGKWYERLKKKCVSSPDRLEELFAFPFYAWSEDIGPESPSIDGSHLNSFKPRDALHYDFLNEYNRMGFNKDRAWKITDINSKFELCPSYPKLHIVPSHITDEKLENIAKFRASRRFPSAVWRHKENGAVIVRCSQPEVGWLYWRCEDDEFYLQTLGKVIDSAKPVLNGDDVTNGFDSSDDANDEDSETNGHSEQDNLKKQKAICNGVEKKVLVVDCRSYSVAFANRVKGGGSECTEYYPNCKIQFMGLANIHSIRKSFQSLRELCSKQEEQNGWLASLEATKWLSHISSLIKTSLAVVKAIEQEKQHVVVHCSDGWDRTAQVVTLAELLLDPFYRTIEGFRVLLEREWLTFGHKFADRCGHGCQEDDSNERSPVFLQWLDCVHQLLRQFPCSFEFNETFLVKLAQHTYSCLFGTFLCNTEQERLRSNIIYRTCSVWSMFDSQSRNCRNFLYSPQEGQVLYPEYQVRSILLWSSLYLTSPLMRFDISSTNSTDGGLNSQHEFYCDHPRTESESRPSVLRRNSDGDVKVLGTNTDENFVATSGARDDSDLYLTKSLPCKSEASMSPSKGLVVNSLERKSNEDIGGSCGNNVDGLLGCSHKVENCENIAFDQSGKFSEDSGGLNTYENSTIDQTIKNSASLSDSLTSSSHTVVDESFSSERQRDETENAKMENGGPNLDDDVGKSKARTVSKPINCKSNHRLPKSCSADESLQRSGNTLKEYNDTTGSPKEITFNKLSKYLDTDGLAKVVDPVQARLENLERCYQTKIDDLQSQLQAQGCICGPRQYSNIRQDLVANARPTDESQLSVSSNATSDPCGSWERVDDEDFSSLVWVPDHIAVSCGSCQQKFSINSQKQHCRNCSKVFCSSCCNDLTPGSAEQLYDTARVCKSCFGQLHLSPGQDIKVAAS